MKALCYESHGDPRSGVVKNVFDPRPGPGQVVVRVVAAALNPVDWKIVEGRFPFLAFPKKPFVPGCEAAGVVEAMDSRVSGFRAGDEVIVSTGLGGALAEKVAADALIDYRKADFTKAREEWDVVFDVVPNRSFGACRGVLFREGTYVTTLPGAGPLFASLGASLRAPFGFRKRCRWVLLKPRGEDLSRLVQWAGEGALKPVVGKVAPLDQAAWALSDLSAGHVTGKTVIRVA